MFELVRVAGRPKGPASRRLPALRATGVMSAVGLVLALTAPAASAVGPEVPAHAGAPERGVPALFHTHAIADEPTLGVDPQGRIFYQTSAVPPFLSTPVLISSDRGASWARVPADANGNTLRGSGGDPFVTVDPLTGRLFSAADAKWANRADSGICGSLRGAVRARRAGGGPAAGGGAGTGRLSECCVLVRPGGAQRGSGRLDAEPHDCRPGELCRFTRRRKHLRHLRSGCPVVS
jgi:hypothetical protein